ncbi:UNVERIFIED_CONTAM: hypothetical protein GTU68_002340 [Idotea baltica]|nr:hypothetical protein [Idotea baltica]
MINNNTIEEIKGQIERASSFLLEKLEGRKPSLGIVLGSGFAEWAEQLPNKEIIPYASIPGFPTTTVQGHSGNLIIAQIEGHTVLVMQGRFHYYEGHQMALISLPIRVFSKIGIRKILLTNAAGGINATYAPGHLMVITDHINLVQNNPLIGKNLDEFGPRFPDASNIYQSDLITLATQHANQANLSVHRGVYVFVSGPSFETPAEIRMMRTLGADAVGMSTVPEAIVAAHNDMSVVGISMIANLASGMSVNKLTHADVMETMHSVAPKVVRFLNDFITDLVRQEAR